MAQCTTWKSGQAVQIKLDPRDALALRNLLEQYLASADDRLNIAVTNETLQKIRSGAAVEILLPEPIAVESKALKETLRLDRALIPLDINTVVIYFGVNRYANGAVVSRKSNLKSLQELVAPTRQKS